MSTKRGQITVFVILGIVILVAVGVGFYLKAEKEESVVEEKPSPKSMAPVKNFIENCLKQVGEDAIIYNAETGGYFDLSDENLRIAASENIPVYFFEGQDLSPSLEVWERELSAYVEMNIMGCLDNFSMFTEQGFSIEAGNAQATTNIEKEAVFFELEYPLKISTNGDVHDVSMFSSQVNFDLLRVHDLAKEMMEVQSKWPSMHPITSFAELSKEKDMFYAITSGEEGEVFVSLVNEDMEALEDSYVLSFSLKY